MTISVSDIPQVEIKTEVLREADEQVTGIDRQYQRGLITEEERYEQVVQSGRTPPRGSPTKSIECSAPRAI